ncbi:MAG: phosphoenolpyruvate--protein phosphotransferase [Spirochaetales bacterium]|nr:phosphoenolpyruvate--protein phosphotransferase [Spirochaetales bacterium]
MKKETVDLICNVGELIRLFEKSTRVEDFLSSVVSLISEHMNTHVCSIYLYHEAKKKLILKATKGLRPEAIGKVELNLGQGITGRALKELRDICVPKASKSPFNEPIKDIGEEKYEAFLAVPILRGLSRVGVLVLQHQTPGFFDSQDTKTLKAISAQLAVILENAQLMLELGIERKIKISNSKMDSHFIKGISASDGTARGKALKLGARGEALFLTVNSEKTETTLDDFNRAVGLSISQLEQLQKEMEEHLNEMVLLIFSAHLLMLKDETFIGTMKELILDGDTPENAVIKVVNNFIALFSKSEAPLMREKAQDVKDIGHRILRNLKPGIEAPGDYSGQIIIAGELLPSEMVKFSIQRAEGIVLFGGGLTAHIAILAKSLNIPMIMTEDELLFQIEEETDLLIDAHQGHLFINPSKDVIKNYEELKISHRLAAYPDVEEKSFTRDKTRIRIFANINLLSDLKVAKKLKSEGIGLYRSEFPFLIRNELPSEEEQLRVYSKLHEEMNNKEVVFRTLDIGGDKMLSYLANRSESNPFLGLRAIRFSLKNKEIFKTQLRAMLRAGYKRNLNIMFPLISSVDDFLDVKNIVSESIIELEKEKINFNPEPNLGAMIELPSAVEIAPELASETQFMSIGTNDLVQYILGVDRTNEQVSNLYMAHHPAIYRAINRIAKAAQEKNCDLSVCGDIAADPYMIPFLIGIGIRKLSVNPRLIPVVQDRIMEISEKKCKEFARKLLGIGTIKKVKDFLKENESTLT